MGLGEPQVERVEGHFNKKSHTKCKGSNSGRGINGEKSVVEGKTKLAV